MVFYNVKAKVSLLIVIIFFCYNNRNPGGFIVDNEINLKIKKLFNCETVLSIIFALCLSVIFVEAMFLAQADIEFNGYLFLWIAIVSGLMFFSILIVFNLRNRINKLKKELKEKEEKEKTIFDELDNNVFAENNSL